LRHIN